MEQEVDYSKYKFGITDPVAGQNKVPYTPYQFLISRWGGILKKDAQHYYEIRSNNGLTTTSSRYFSIYGSEMKCIEKLTQDGEVVFIYTQERSIQDFDFTSNRSLIEVYLKPSKIQDRRMFLTILAICEQYQLFFKQYCSKELWFDLFIQQGNRFEAKRVTGLNSFRSALTDIQRGYKDYENGKIHTTISRYKNISKTELKNNIIDRVFNPKRFIETASINDKAFDLTKSNISHLTIKKQVLPIKTIYKLYDDGQLVSSCSIHNKMIWDLFTEKDYRSKGYASKLLDYILDKENIIGIKASAYTNNDGLTNNQLKEFYESKGLKVF